MEMLVSVEASGSLERRMKVQVPAERIDGEVVERLRRFGKNAKIKGFRPGKAPLKVIRQQYGQQVRQEVLGEVVRTSYSEAINKEQLVPAGGPRFETDSVAEGKDLIYTAIFEVFPDIELKGLENIKIEEPDTAIESEDVGRMLENLRKQRATWEPVSRRSEDTDQVTLDFEGRIDGEPFEGGDGKGVKVTVGAGQMLKDFEDGLIGVEQGDRKTLEVGFPDDYPAENLAGKTAQFEIHVLAVEAQALPDIDEDFCREFGVTEGGPEKLREEVQANMQRELNQTVRGKLRSQVLEALLNANPVDLPAALVADEARNLQMESARRMGIEDPAHLPPPEPFEAQAKRRVGLALLVNELIRTQGLNLDQERVSAKLSDLASGYKDSEEVIKAYRGNPQLLSQVETMVQEDQVVDWLLERSKIKKVKSSFAELMNFQAG